MHKLTQLISADMCPALGVTEPGAIAFSVAKAKEQTEGELLAIHVVLNSGMYKNAYTCGIPNSLFYGNEYAAALGYVAADASRGLECLSGVKAADNKQARQLVREGRVKVELGEISSRLSITTTIETNHGTARVCIEDTHTHIVRIEKNGVTVFESAKTQQKDPDSKPPIIHTYSLRQIFNYVRRVDISELSFIRKAYDINLQLFAESLRSGRTPFTHHLYRKNGDRILSDDETLTASLLSGGAIEARVLGLSRPAMSITGSGAHGIIATLPLYAVQQLGGLSDEALLRATALSFLICMYIKEYSGRLSAFCGCAIAAGTGAACAIAYLKGGGYKELVLTLQNMASSITGMICDGGNHGCTMKAIVGVDAAFQSAGFALDGIVIENIHGINGKTPEETMRNMGLIASPGMTQTEKVIVDIMQHK